MEMKYTFSTMEGKCYIWGKPGHKSPQCKLRNKIPREEWAITKAKQTHAMEIDEPAQQKLNLHQLVLQDLGNRDGLVYM